MLGILRIIDRAGEREIELPRSQVVLGSQASDTIRVEGEVSLPSALTLDWDERRGTWAASFGGRSMNTIVAVNGRVLSPGDRVLLVNLDCLDMPGVFLQFNRQLASPKYDGVEAETISLADGRNVSIGRGGESPVDVGSHRVDLDADEPGISRTHVTIVAEGGDYIIEDMSRAGTELNGVAFTRERLVFGDRFRICGYIFEFTGDAIRRIQPECAGSIRARNLVFVAGGRQILDNVSLDIAAGEFIGVLGGSGQGKSTLLNALCGINPPTSGQIWIGDIPITDRARLREIGIGYVPQDDIVHKELTVAEAITYSARLRLRLPPHQIEALVSRVVSRLGLSEHAAKRIADLSGGQRKRVSIAIELLSKPSVLFLDEPSSGLDPATEESLMTLLQSLKLTKLTIVCTTHVLQKAYLFDRILFVQGGKLVFAGNSDEARQHFLGQEGNTSQYSPLERIYSLLAAGTKTPAEWEQEYAQSEYACRATPPIPPSGANQTKGVGGRPLKVGPLRTLTLLMQRQWSILRADIMNLVFLAAQPLIIGLLIGWVADKSALRMFLCIVATMWFGCSNGAQQIVAELPIFRRERVCGQGLNVYVLSKLIFLSLASMGQALVLLLTVLTVTQLFHPENYEATDKEITARFMPLQTDTQVRSQEEFSIVDSDEPASAATPAPTPSQKTKTTAEPSRFVVQSVTLLCKYFQITPNLLDSGPRFITKADGTSFKDAAGLPMILPGTSVFNVLAIALGLRFFAIAIAAMVGVTIGLTISSLVNNATQAVLWVPLVLIPQILFGGVVVTVPEMSTSVRIFSQLMPSAAAQRIMDVAALYGVSTPFLSNRTKVPLFLSSRGEKESMQWQVGDRSFSQDYDKLSPINISWQNLAVIPEFLGQHKQAGNPSEDGFRIDYRDTVEVRHDVRFTKGTVFRSLQSFHLAVFTLVGWTAVGYGLILAGLRSKQTGK